MTAAPAVGYFAVVDVLGQQHPALNERFPRDALELVVDGTDGVTCRWLLSIDVIADIIWRLMAHPDVTGVVSRVLNPADG